MPYFDTYLYANGALRLTQHGDRAGGTVLMHVGSGAQFNVPDNRTRQLAVEIADWLLFEFDPERTFVVCRAIYTDLNAPNKI